MSVPRPQDTECTTIEVEDDGTDVGSQGVTNGIISMIAGMRNVEYDEERDAYIVGESK